MNLCHRTLRPLSALYEPSAVACTKSRCTNENNSVLISHFCVKWIWMADVGAPTYTKIPSHFYKCEVFCCLHLWLTHSKTKKQFSLSPLNSIPRLRSATLQVCLHMCTQGLKTWRKQRKPITRARLPAYGSTVQQGCVSSLRAHSIADCNTRFCHSNRSKKCLIKWEMELLSSLHSTGSV